MSCDIFILKGASRLSVAGILFVLHFTIFSVINKSNVQHLDKITFENCLTYGRNRL